jgi:hypothetical protein
MPLGVCSDTHQTIAGGSMYVQTHGSVVEREACAVVMSDVPLCTCFSQY